jgi:DNA-binding MarR family transcriptional regulator
MIGPLTEQQFDLLELISISGSGIDRDSLARRLAIKPESATTRVMRAKRVGLVETFAQKRDIPAIVTLTEHGMTMLAEAYATLDQRVAA